MSQYVMGLKTIIDQDLIYDDNQNHINNNSNKVIFNINVNSSKNNTDSKKK